MLNKLIVHNYAIIEHLELELDAGLNIITGETGAGKSILLGALGLIMGDRADTKVLYDESQKCFAEAYFDVSRFDLSDWLAEHDLEYSPEMTVRREIAASGKSRAFIEDTPVTLDVLRSFTSRLVDLHEQFDTLDIQQASFQMEILDALAGNQPLLKNYQAAYRQWQQAARRLQELEQALSQGNKEQDFQQFLWEELEESQLTAGEQAELEAAYETLSHAGDIQTRLAAVLQLGSESEFAIQNQLRELLANLREAAGFDPQIMSLYERIFALQIEFADSLSDLQRIYEVVDIDPERLQQLQDRLQLIYKLQKKHQVSSIEHLIEIRDELALKLESTLNLASDIEAARADLQRWESELEQEAALLSQRRAAVTEAFVEQVSALLGELAMPHATLQVQLNPAPQFTTSGKDQVQILFAANRGSKLKPIKDVASGGELSRLALCVKTVIAGALSLPTLIFDEIDSGVSGDVAHKIGAILKRLSRQHQVITITHSPQVAAKGDRHFFVHKEVVDTKTFTRVKNLPGEARVEAIAIMLSSNPPSATALQHAKELLASA